MEQKRLPIFAERFAKLRGDMTQGEFADTLGISRPTVGFYENGSRLPDALVLRQIAEKCKVSSDWLLGLSDEPSLDVDIQKVCKYTGLSSPAIMILAKEKKRHPQIDVYNYLLEHRRFLYFVVNFFADFTLSKLNKNPYKYIPLKEGSVLTYYRDIHFAAAIRSMQEHRDKFEEKYKNDEDFERKAIFSFLFKHADIEKCKEIIGLIEDQNFLDEY